jgi:hypothetical protein
MSRRIFNSCISFSSTDSNICIASNMMYYKFSVYLCSGRVHWRCLNIFIPAISTAQLEVDTGSCGKVRHRKHRLIKLRLINGSRTEERRPCQPDSCDSTWVKYLHH